jgi:carboxyl-terminal processing protease
VATNNFGIAQLLRQCTPFLGGLLVSLSGLFLVSAFPTSAVLGQDLQTTPTRSAPQAISAPAIDVSILAGDVEGTLEQGRQFETEQRWSEALSLYDAAARRFPDNSDLQRHRTLAEIHCDLDRRLIDSSYQQVLTANAERKVLDLFDELMTKIQAHYYDNPDWQRITWRGTANLDIALTKPDFRKRYLPNVADDNIKVFRQILRNDVNQRQVRSEHDAHNLVAYAARLATQHLGLPLAPCVGEYCCGAISSLDQYSTYLSGAQLDDVYGQIEGNFVGLGIELKAEGNELLVVKVIHGGPAFHSGVHAGDTILAVNGQETKNVSAEGAADLLKGDEGTFAEIAVLGADRQVRSLRIRRQRVEVPSVEETAILDPNYGVGYFRLTGFQRTTSTDVDNALWQLQRQGMRILIMDLRGNPGGLLTAAVEVADKFLQDGSIVSTRGRSERENFKYEAHPAGSWKIPLVVLIDRDTASASEIFAGAIKDHNRGTIIGERSYGKGSVQGIFPLSTIRSGVRITTAKFFSPSGQAISDRGVVPHREVQMVARPNTITGMYPSHDEDPFIIAARDEARRIAVANR